ncbi:AAA family ATPase [Streptomyces sp. NPDC052101]|uniref:helix-turn-helix transcriptional regulator n=1 Tax=Streptomyces sp. NPDC052101 TaxID=3155763 RepID=UPI0034483D31
MTTLIERAEALATLRRLVDEAARGRGGTALVSGTVASGKSALLDALAQALTGTGTLTLTAVASAAETGLPLAVFDQLLARAPLTPGQRQHAKALLAKGSEPMEADSRLPDRMASFDGWLARELCTLLIDLSDQQPLTLLVDDAHHADPASLVCLAYLVRRIRESRITAVFAHSDASPYRNTRFWTELLRRPSNLHLSLPLLTPAGVNRMVADRLGDEAADRIAAQCHTLSGGNPLLVKALLDDQPADHTDLIVGETYGRAVVGSLHRGGPQLLETAQGLAILGSSETVDRLLDRDSKLVVQTLGELNATGVLDAGRFRHPMARRSVLVDLPPERRAQLHARAAEAAHADGAPATVVAEHLLAAEHTSPFWAVATLEQAATTAMVEGSVRSAVAYLKLACRDCPDSELLTRLRIALIKAEWRINPGACGQHLSALVDSFRNGLMRGSDALVLSRALLWHGRYKEAEEVLSRIGDMAEDPDIDVEMRITQAWMRWSYAPLLGRVQPLRSPPSGADGASLRAGWRLEAVTALESVQTRGPSEKAIADAERVLRDTRLNEMGMDTAEAALLALTFAERASLAGPWCDGLIDDAVSREESSHQARLAGIRAEISVRQGDLPGAERHARQALAILPAASWGVTIGAVLGSLLLALTGMGRYDAAVDELSRPVPEEMLQSRYGLHYLQARGRFKLATGRLDSAMEDFQTCGSLMRAWGLEAPGLVSWRTDLAETWLGLGDREESRRLVEEQLALVGNDYPRARGSALRLLAANLELRHRPGVLREAVEALRTSGDRYELARALTDLTETYLALGETRRARLIGREASSLALACHANPLGKALGDMRVGTDTAQLEPSPAGTSSELSDAERRVVDLAAMGHSNREIATRLYVTVSTVEQHLTKAYRKLGVRSRAGLLSALV